MGKVPASNGRFAGSMMLKPENPSTTASLLRDTILKKIKSGESGLIDERVDTVRSTISPCLPRASFEKGCVWNGNLVYAYQTESWFIEITAKCAGKTYEAEGQHALHRHSQRGKPEPVRPAAHPALGRRDER